MFQWWSSSRFIRRLNAEGATGSRTNCSNLGNRILSASGKNSTFSNEEEDDDDDGDLWGVEMEEEALSEPLPAEFNRLAARIVVD